MKTIGHMLYDAEDVKVMNRLVNDIEDNFLGMSSIVGAVGRFFMSRNVAKEAKEIKRDYGVDVRAANISYEASVAAQMPMEWCTSMAINGHMVKSLDWPVHSMKKKDCLIDFGDFISIGYPGLLGVITGVRPGGYAITVNMDAFADIRHIAPLGTPVLFLLRECLEKAKTFDDAVSFISDKTTVAPAFVHIVGVSKSAVVYTKSHKVFNARAITNHNPEMEDVECDRLAAANRMLRSGSLRSFCRSPIRNEDTVCQHYINVKTGEVRRM